VEKQKWCKYAAVGDILVSHLDMGSMWFHGENREANPQFMDQYK